MKDEPAMQDGNETINDQRLTVDQAIRFAMELQQRSKLDQAEGVYREILSAVPHHPDALHFLGVLQYQRGHTDQSILLITQALEGSPDYVDAHNNLGNIYMEEGRPEEAEAAYRRTVELAPRHLGARNNLGTVLRALGRFDDAESLFRNALKDNPDFYPLHYNLGYLLYQQGKVDEAVDHFFKAVVLAPLQSSSKVLLGIALVTLGRREEAVKMYHEWLGNDPEDPEAQYLLSAVSGEAVPDRAPDDYVKKLFDRFAASFEERLNLLQYKAPRLVAEALSQAFGQPVGNLAILDAGCGTGLCGPWLKPYAHRLDGVDLSEGMLKRAARTDSYDRLSEAELTAFFRLSQAAYDVIVSADTLCYFGDLQEAFAAAAVALKPDGRFILTVERADAAGEGNNSGYHILPQGRYAHSEDYVRRMSKKSGFEPESIYRVVLRQEMGRPVNGLVVTLVKMT